MIINALSLTALRYLPLHSKDFSAGLHDSQVPKLGDGGDQSCFCVGWFELNIPTCINLRVWRRLNLPDGR